MEKSNLNLEQQESPQARDVLQHFNKNIYPLIREQHHPDTEQRKKSLMHTLGFKKLVPSKRSYEKLGTETAKGIIEFTLKDQINDKQRVQLLLNVMRVEMNSTAYFNARLNFKNASNRYKENGQKNLAEIIDTCLGVCNKKFKKGLTTLTITENHIISESGYGTNIHSKKDFFS